MTTRSSSDFNKFHFSLATPADNPALIAHMRKHPIHMEMDYIMDRHDDFFKVQKIYPESQVVIARDTETGEIAGCLSLLKLRGRLSGESISFRYITDLVKSEQAHTALLMKKLLNYTFENFFDTDLIFGLINAENKRARLFSTSNVLHYQGAVAARFNYFEIIPLSKHRIPKRYTFRFADHSAAQQLALDFINRHYQNHLLFEPLGLPFFQQMLASLPGFSPQNLVMLYEESKLSGVMMLYNPSEVVSLIIARMDPKTRFLLRCIRFIHRLSGLLFDPPMEGERIKTLQVRYLAGTPVAQSILLRYANNFAYQNQLHSVSMLADERDEICPENWMVYQYKSLMYAGYKTAFSEKMGRFAEHPVFFDITLS